MVKYLVSRTPQGVRGLKYVLILLHFHSVVSHPARGAWIEIFDGKDGKPVKIVAPRKGCVD